MKYTTPLLIGLIAMATAVTAQRQSPLELMNSIKASNDYLWEEYTHPQADSAALFVLERLLLGDFPDSCTITVEQLRPHTKTIRINRGKLTRVFAYIAKKDARQLVHATQQQATAVTTDNPQTPMAKPEPTPPPFVADPLARVLMEKTSLTAVYNHLTTLRQQGDIGGCGPMKSTTQPARCRLAIFSRDSQTIVCVLSAEDAQGCRINLVTGQKDSFDHYEDGQHLAIWYETE